jgi:copper transport protein
VVSRRLLTLLALLWGVAALVPAAAGAHASLKAAAPQNGAVLDAAPERVVFRFSEGVEGSFGALRVVDERGRRVDDGAVTRPDGRRDALAVGLRPGTPKGAFAATYRVVSADGHPVSGGVTFVVGRDVTAAPPDVRELTEAQAAPAGIGTALSIARAVRYVGIGGAVGVPTLLLAVWAPLRRRGDIAAPADDAFSRATGRALRSVALLGAVGAAAALVLQTANAGGTGIGDALRPGPIGDVLGTRTGAWFAISLLALLALAGLAGRLARATDRLRAPLPVAALVLLALLVLAPAVGGHAAASSPAWALVPIQTVHVAAMGAWVGGLLGLVLVLPRATRALPPGRPRMALLSAVLLRFSPIALVSVAALTVAGTGLALLHLTTLYDLTDTAYGRAILVKVVLLVVIIGIAVVQRELLLPRLKRLAAGEEPEVGAPAATDTPTAADTPVETDTLVGTDTPVENHTPVGTPAPPGATGRHVRLALRSELALLLAVLVATGALAGYAPPKSLSNGPVSVTRDAGRIQLQLTVDPARRGPNAMHLYAIGADGQPVRSAEDLKVRAVPPGRAGGSDVPVDVPFVVSGPGHWTAASVPLGTAGGWTVEVTLRTSAFDQVEAKLPVRVR